MPHNNLQTQITNEIVTDFAQETINIFSGLLQMGGKLIGHSRLESCLESHRNIFISVYFTGIVYGEFVLALDEETAFACIVKSGLLQGEIPTKLTRDDYGILTEALNIIAGTTIKKLGLHFDKLTMTAPRVYFGKILYPKFITGLQKVELNAGELDCFFYYDQMQLDLAVSYQDALQSLISTNRILTQVNEKIRSQQAQLVQSEKLASLGTMAAGIAHEINNPLAYVDSNISTLEDYSHIAHSFILTHERIVNSFRKRDKDLLKKSLSEIDSLNTKGNLARILEDTRDIFEETRTGIKRIKEIVVGLKRFSHVDQDRFSEVDLNDEIENMLRLVANQLKYKCEIVRHFGDLELVSCFPGQLNQVFVNLLVNAAQAMPNENGKIEITTSRTPEGYALISFSDNGCGISEENLGKIYDPFFSTKPVGEGTGLGLAISYGIIKRHNGSISVMSKPNQGTTFTISIPVRQTYEDCKSNEE